MGWWGCRGGGWQEESHSSAVHSSGHIPLTTQRAHFEGDILCAVWQAEQAREIYCGCVSIQERSGRCPRPYWQGAQIYCSWETPSGRLRPQVSNVNNSSH